MFKDFPLFPRAASTIADDIDAFYFFMVGTCGFLALLIVCLIFYFALKYRRLSDDEIPSEEEAPQWVEVVWIVVPFFILMGMFLWGAWLYFKVSRPPDDALDIYVTGKQWMWRFQHIGGQSEINALHVPVGRPVRLIMASEDVIHSFFVPEFRVHTDVLPSRYTYNWFEATRVGKYHLFCSEYCGTEHSGMTGSVFVMEPGDYQTWLSGGAQGAPADEGKKLFEKLACISCHIDQSTGRGPSLIGLSGQIRPLQNGTSVKADENYLRESILNPQAKIAAGFQPIMPTFQGQVNEQQLIQLIAYIKTLSQRTQPAAPAVAGTPQITPSGGNASQAEEQTKAPTQSGSNVTQSSSPSRAAGTPE